MSNNNHIIENKTTELTQLEHLEEVSEQFVKVINGINNKFDTILDGTKMVVDVSRRWNDVFQLINLNNTNNGNLNARDLLMIETLDDEEER
jgi:hypothetical protein